VENAEPSRAEADREVQEDGDDDYVTQRKKGIEKSSGGWGVSHSTRK